MKPPTGGSYAFRDIDEKEPKPQIDKKKLVASIESVQTKIPESLLVRNRLKVANVIQGQAIGNDRSVKSAVLTIEEQITDRKPTTIEQSTVFSNELPIRDIPSSHKLRHEEISKGANFVVEVSREQYLDYLHGGGLRQPPRKPIRHEKTEDPYEYFEDALQNDYYKFDPVPKYADGSYLERIEKQHLQYLTAVDKRLKKIS